MKGTADALHDLGDPVSDRVLVLNVLRGLSSTYDHLKSWIARQRHFPSFLQVRDDLALEEITRSLAPGSSSPTPTRSSLLLRRSCHLAPWCCSRRADRRGGGTGCWWY